MYPIKQSTALTVPFFAHDASGDAVTGLVDAGFTKRISKNGGAFGAMTVTITEMENGWYSFPLSTSHSDTTGLLSITFTHASCKQVNLQFRVHASLPDDIASDTAVIEAKTSDTHSRLVVVETAVDSDQTSRATAISDIKSALTVVETGTTAFKYLGGYGPGVYLDSGAANTNTVTGTDGTVDNPVSTFGAARTIANAIGVTTYYIVGNSDFTGGASIAATHEDWTFVGMGEVTANVMDLNSQDVDRSQFINLTIQGTQGGTGRISCIECALQDPGAGDTTLNVFALRCGIVDRIQIDTSADNVFDQCYSLVAGNSAPVVQATGASGTVAFRHYSGGIEFETLSASHNVSVETDGQVIFAADCNVAATVALRGNMTITDNTAGMISLTTGAVYDKRATISDIHSRLVVVEAAIDSDQTSRAAAISAVRSDTTVIEAKASDTHSRLVVVETAIDSDQTSRATAIAAVKSDTAVIETKASDTHSRLVVVETAIDSDQTSRTTAVSDVKSQLTLVEAITTALGATAAANLKISAEHMVTGTVDTVTNTHTPTTTEFQADDITEATADHYNGRVVIFTSGALQYQATDITDYAAVGGIGQFTVTAMTEAPANNDTFIIV